MRITMRLTLRAVLLLVPVPVWAAKVPLVEANHMRWENHEVVVGNAIAWQEELDGRWATVVLLTDRPVPRESVGPGLSTDEAVKRVEGQGIAFAITAGGVPLLAKGTDVWFRDGAEIRASIVTGAGGFDIDSQSATQIKGRATLSAFGITASKSENAWSLSFDAPVLHGDAKRMQAEGEPLGSSGGQPAKDLQAALQAKRAMDYATLSAYASPELAAFLSDPAQRSKNLEMLRGMASPQSRTVGGLRQGDKAQLYWVQIWPDALDSRCIDDLILQDGKWRTVASACQAE